MQSSIPAPLFLAQSEAVDWLGCPLRAWARYVLGYRPPDDEDRPRRIGSMGHAVVNDRVRARFANFDGTDPDEAIREEAEKRGWSSIDDAEADRAKDAAARLWDALDLDRVAVAPNLYGDDPGGPLSEVRLKTTWLKVQAAMCDHAAIYDDISQCHAVRQRFSGMEGQPDLVTFPYGPAGPAVVLDFKFRQKVDSLGAAIGMPQDERGVWVADADEGVPDRQASWYLVLLHAAGLRPAGGIEFWQANAFAGRWLDVDDFVNAVDGSGDPEDGDLVLKTGLPTADLKRLAKVGHCTAEVWAEAHRVLANRRLDRRLADYRRPRVSEKTGRALSPGKPPDRLSFDEETAARQFIDLLERTPTVVVRRFRADPSVCREVVRDMIVGVDAHLAQVQRGMVPARHLQVYPSSPCIKPHGCQIKVPCMASHGSSSIERALRDLAAQGALQAAPALGLAAAGLRGSC